jgi:hypothetical protein
MPENTVNILDQLFELVADLQADTTVCVISRNEAYQINADELPEHANEQVKKYVRAKVLTLLKPRPRVPRTEA